jgi:hypothetical protein
MSVQPVVLGPDQHEPALNGVGTQVTVLASNAGDAKSRNYLTAGRRRNRPLRRIATI